MGDFMEDHISRYGKIFSSHLLGREAIVSADAEFNRFVQNKDVKLFRAVWLPAFAEILGKESLAFSIGEEHKRLRSTIFDFLSFKRLQTFFLRDADLTASSIVKSWKDGSVISAKEESIKYSMKIMAKSTLSIMADDCQMEKLIREFSHILPALFSLPLYLPGMKYWMGLKARRNILKTVKKTIKDRINLKSKDCSDGKGEVQNLLNVEGQQDCFDLLDLLLSRRNEYSNEAIEDFILGMLFAGHDTSSRALAFMLYHLAYSPDVVKRLQEEHLQIAKSKSKIDYNLSWDDYINMEFTSCVIKETLRLGNVAPLIPKKASEDVEYKGIVIPQGSLVVVHMRAVHLDPSIYDKPMHFNPWRWMDSSCGKSNKSYMPFGGGAKKCPGANFAYLEMAVFLHRIILNYEWQMAQQDLPKFIPYLEFPEGLPIRLRSIQMFK